MKESGAKKLNEAIHINTSRRTETTGPNHNFVISSVLHHVANKLNHIYSITFCSPYSQHLADNGDRGSKKPTAIANMLKLIYFARGLFRPRRCTVDKTTHFKCN